jgi:hypothetical protein
MNRRYLAQHLNLGNGFVVLRKRIPPHHPPRVAFLEQTMDKKPPTPRHQHNVSRNNLFPRLAFDAENVAWPDRRKHTAPKRPQSQSAARAENLRRKIESRTGLGHYCHGELRTLPIEAALQFGGTHLAARQSHGFEDPLVPEFRFLVRLLPGTSAIVYVFVINIRVFFHKSPRVLDRLWATRVTA